jgi:kynurenine formamidase
MPRLIELNHVIEDGMITYKGLPAPVICDFLSRSDSRANYEAGTEFQIGMITLCSNTGTYLHTPFHRYADGKSSRVARVRLAEPRLAGARTCWGRVSRSSSI